MIDIDIVERLEISVTKGHEPTDADAIDAAAEIERLRAEVKNMHEMIGEIDRQHAADPLAENERLRAARVELQDAVYKLLWKIDMIGEIDRKHAANLLAENERLRAARVELQDAVYKLLWKIDELST